MEPELDYSIRFIGISEQDASHLKKSLGDSASTLRKNRRNPGSFIFTTAITESNAGSVKELVESVKADKIDLFFSLVMTKDCDIIEAPRFLKNLLAIESVSLTFSYTYIGDD